MSQVSDTPLVAVIMAVYNCEKWLRASIASILAQTFTNFELIVVDDGSTDSSLSIISEYARNDRRVRVIRKANTGLAESLNAAISISRSPYLARMDGDDICLPERFEKQVAFLESHPAIDILGGSAIVIDNAGNVSGRLMVRTTHEELCHHIWTENPFVHPTVMIRRTVFTTNGGYAPALRRGQDQDLWLRCRKNHRFHNLPDVVLLYRRSPKPRKRLSNAYWSCVVIWRAIHREQRHWGYLWYALRPLFACVLPCSLRLFNTK